MLARKPTERIADFVVHQAYLALRVVVIHECLELLGCELLLRRERVHRTLPQPLHTQRPRDLLPGDDGRQRGDFTAVGRTAGPPPPGATLSSNASSSS